MMQEWDDLVGLSSVVIALCALIFTVWAGWRTHVHNKLLVKPKLMTWISSEQDQGYYSVEFRNNGLGPALVENYTIKVDGEIMHGEATEPIENAVRLIFKDITYHCTVGILDTGYLLPANDKCGIFALKFSKPGDMTRKEFIEQFKRFQLDIFYKSLYGDKFTYSSKD
jgi:hypothetical protein